MPRSSCVVVSSSSWQLKCDRGSFQDFVGYVSEVVQNILVFFFVSHDKPRTRQLITTVNKSITFQHHEEAKLRTKLIQCDA